MIACPSNYNQIYCLAYSYHLGALLLEKPDHNKSIKASRIKAWTRTYRLFKAIGYEQIYRTKKLTLKHISNMSGAKFNQLVDFCEWYKSRENFVEQNS